MAGVSQIGVMSFYFSAEQLADDQIPQNAPAPANIVAIGTIKGKDIPTPVIKVGVKKLYKDPVETWHIAYQYKAADTPSAVPVVVSNEPPQS